MSTNINCEFVGMKKNNGKSKSFKYLQEELKRNKKTEEIMKAIQKIQNDSNKKEKIRLKPKPKRFKIYENSKRNIKEDIECCEQSKEDVVRELNYDYDDYHEQWSNIQINLNHDYDEDNDYLMDKQEDKLNEADNSFLKQPDEDIEDKFSDLEDYEKRNEKNEAIYDVCEDNNDSQYDDIDEYLQPIIPRHIELESKIRVLEEKLSIAQETMYQLLGGLFNHDTQENVLKAYADILYTGKAVYRGELEKNQFPTTRQGDANEKRIQQLEENIDILVKRLKKGKPLHRFYRKFQKK
jgi:hypothetical protein